MFIRFNRLMATAVLMAIGANVHALSTGDIAFTSFNADEDGWSLVSFVNLAPNTTIYFTDNEWNGSAIGSGGAFNTGERYHQWNTGASTVNAGTVVRFSDVDKTSLAASIGNLSFVTVAGNTNPGLGNDNETLYAYLGSSVTAPTSFLGAITNSNFSNADGTLNGTGLTSGTNAIQLRTSGSPDYGVYNGIRSGLASYLDYLPLVSNRANWTVDTINGNYATTVPNTTAFTVNAVPVPAAAWLFGGAMASVSLVSGRRRKV